MSDPVVVDALTVRGSNGQELVGPITFRIAAGAVTALTGPSGSGKTTLMRALLGHLPTGAARSGGSALVSGHDVFALNPKALQRFRRDHIAYVGQDPGSALNPMMRVRTLLDEVSHPSAAALHETLELVGLSAAHLRRRPGELSGGQQRRVALARALVRHTGILVLDEPLAGLHGSLRTEIARLLVDIAAQRRAAILLSGHDTATIHTIADDVVELGAVPTEGIGVALHLPVPRAAPVVPVVDRSAEADDVLSPVHEASAVPVSVSVRPILAGNGSVAVQARTVELAAEPSAPLLRARDINASIGGTDVLADIDLALPSGAALAIAGASGAGKTTLARVIAGLHRTATGSLELGGKPVPVGRGRRTRNGRKGIQLVTQNPLSALNPRRTVAQTLGRPLHRIGGVPKRQLAQHIADLLDSVELAPDMATRYPHELSGGQRQRVALARALAAEPAVLVCDEITSALDHTTAVSIMRLLDRIRADHDTGLLVITHDMTIVAGHCSHLVVLDHGRIVESGEATTVLAAPTHTATRELLG